MRIIYIHQYFITPDNAGSTRSYEMARRLVQFGHIVHMITTDRNPVHSKKRNWSKTIEYGIHVHRYPIPYSNKMSYFKRIIAFFDFVYHAARKAALIEADIIFATSTPLTIGLPAIYASRKQKIPMVFEVRDLWPEIPIAMGILRNKLIILLARFLEKMIYTNSQSIVALSPGMKVGITRSGYSENCVHVIPNGCDIELFSNNFEQGLKFRAQNQWLLSRPLVVYTGTLGVVNGVCYMVYLASKVKEIDPEIRFLIVGDGCEYNKIVKLAKNLCVLHENLFIFKEMPKKKIPMVLTAADLATSFAINLKELWNNSANKFFDALAAGTPIAINYEGWQAEIIRKYNNGIVLSPTDYDMAANKMISFLRDKQQLKEAGQAAIKLARIKYDRDIQAKNLENVLLSVFSSKGAVDKGLRQSRKFSVIFFRF